MLITFGDSLGSNLIVAQVRPRVGEHSEQGPRRILLQVIDGDYYSFKLIRNVKKESEKITLHQYKSDY